MDLTINALLIFFPVVLFVLAILLIIIKIIFTKQNYFFIANDDQKQIIFFKAGEAVQNLEIYYAQDEEKTDKNKLLLKKKTIKKGEFIYLTFEKDFKNAFFVAKFMVNNKKKKIRASETNLIEIKKNIKKIKGNSQLV